MNKIAKLFITFISALTLTLTSITSSFAKVEGDMIVLGSAISLTGKYSSNGVHTQNGYNLAVERLNKMGGVKVGGKSYKFKIIKRGSFQHKFDQEYSVNRVKFIASKNTLTYIKANFI